jgi:hypothetical protein
VAKIVDDLDTPLEFYRYPAEHWIHLRTTNPIESTFATVRLRSRVTKGPGSRTAGIAMAYKLIDAAQARWRAVNAPAPGRPRARRSGLPERQIARTPSRHHPTRTDRIDRNGGRLKHPDPQIFTIPHALITAHRVAREPSVWSKNRAWMALGETVHFSS